MISRRRCPNRSLQLPISGDEIAAPSDETPAISPVSVPTVAPAGKRVCTKSGRIGLMAWLPMRSMIRDANAAISGAEASTSSSARP